MDIFTDWFLGTIKCIKKRLTNIVVILKAQLSVKGLKVVRNVFKISCFQVFKLKLIIRAFINLLKNSFTFSPLQFKINQLIYLLIFFFKFIAFFLNMPYKLISFLTAYKVLLAGLSVGVYFCTETAIGVTSKTQLIQVLLAVAVVYKVGV